MAELDYAFIADFAQVQPNGTLTVVGASWTYLTVPGVPGTHRLSVAGRVRMRQDEEPASLTLEAVGPDKIYTLRIDSELGPGTQARPYGPGLVGVLFALDLGLPLPVVGLYTLTLRLAGQVARQLAFDVVLPDQDG